MTKKTNIKLYSIKNGVCGVYSGYATSEDGLRKLFYAHNVHSDGVITAENLEIDLENMIITYDICFLGDKQSFSKEIVELINYK